MTKCILLFVVIAMYSCNSYKEEYDELKIDAIFLKHQLDEANRREDSLLNILKDQAGQLQRMTNPISETYDYYDAELTDQRKEELNRYFNRKKPQVSTQLGETGGLPANPKYDVSTYKLNGEINKRE